MGMVGYYVFFQQEFAVIVIVWLFLTLDSFHKRWLAIRYERQQAAIRPERLVRVKTMENPWEVVYFVTCAREEPWAFELLMKGLREQKGLKKATMMVMLDRYHHNENPDLTEAKDHVMRECREIAERYADHVWRTSLRNKRGNLENLQRLAEALGILPKPDEASPMHQITAFVDSDAPPDDEWTVALACDQFYDTTIGGVTTSQRVLREKTIYEKCNAWQEEFRIHSPMAASSYYKQVGCLPGRMYFVRNLIVRDFIREGLAREYWEGRFKPIIVWLGPIPIPWFRKWRVRAMAGDDRQITNETLDQRWDTVMSLEAGVKTLVPDTRKKEYDTKRRWGTSSQGYVHRRPRPLLRNPYALYRYLVDILTTYWMALTFTWILFFSWWLSQREHQLEWWWLIPLGVVGMTGTFILRQWSYLRLNPHRWRILPQFMVLVTWERFIRLQAHWTPWGIESWRTRGVDQDANKKRLWIEPLGPVKTILTPALPLAEWGQNPETLLS